MWRQSGGIFDYFVTTRPCKESTPDAQCPLCFNHKTSWSNDCVRIWKSHIATNQYRFSRQPFARIPSRPGCWIVASLLKQRRNWGKDLIAKPSQSWLTIAFMTKYLAQIAATSPLDRVESELRRVLDRENSQLYDEYDDAKYEIWNSVLTFSQRSYSDLDSSKAFPRLLSTESTASSLLASLLFSILSRACKANRSFCLHPWGLRVVLAGIHLSSLEAVWKRVGRDGERSTRNEQQWGGESSSLHMGQGKVVQIGVNHWCLDVLWKTLPFDGVREWWADRIDWWNRYEQTGACKRGVEWYYGYEQTGWISVMDKSGQGLGRVVWLGITDEEVTQCSNRGPCAACDVCGEAIDQMWERAMMKCGVLWYLNFSSNCSVYQPPRIVGSKQLYYGSWTFEEHVVFICCLKIPDLGHHILKVGEPCRDSSPRGGSRIEEKDENTGQGLRVAAQTERVFWCNDQPVRVWLRGDLKVGKLRGAVPFIILRMLTTG